MQDIFVDRLGNVTIAAGVARLDFLRVESIDNEKKQMTLKPSVRIAMPLDGLVQAMQMLEQIKAQLAAQLAGQSAQPDTKIKMAPASDVLVEALPTK